MPVAWAQRKRQLCPCHKSALDHRFGANLRCHNVYYEPLTPATRRLKTKRKIRALCQVTWTHHQIKPVRCVAKLPPAGNTLGEGGGGFV